MDKQGGMYLLLEIKKMEKNLPIDVGVAIPY